MSSWPWPPNARQQPAASLDSGRPESHAVEVARGRIESALQELAASLGKAQAELASAGEVLGKSRPARRLSVSGDWQPRPGGDQQAVDSPRRSSKTSTGHLGPKPNGGAAATGADAETGDTVDLSFMRRSSGESDVRGEVDAEMLPDTWPASLQIRRWETQLSHGESSDALGVTRSSRSLITKVPTGSSDDLVVALRRSNSYSKRLSSTAVASENKGRRHCVVHPNSPGRMIYDILGASFLVFDILAIPVLVAWEVKLEGILLWAACVTAVFWTVDIFMSFITATQRHGELVFDLRIIRTDYMRRWFVPDVVIVLCDWLTLLVLSSTGWRMLRFAKLGRFFRLAAMFRLLKISRVLEEFAEVHLSDIGTLTMRFIKMFFLTLVYAHFLACVWFLIGRVGPTSTGVRWTNVESDLGGEFVIDFDDQTQLYQYTTSFHWAMSQITLGAMEISCTTTFERIYTVFCLLTGLLFGSTLVSSLSATMLEVQMDKRESHDKMQKMRRYLRENRVNRAIAAQVERQLAERLTTKEKLKQDQVLGLQQLSAFLRAQLQFEMLAPYLRSRPLFQLWIHMDTAVVQTFCQECTEFQTLRTQDDLFLAGSEATHAYYFLQGGLTYTQEPESSPVCDSVTKTVGEDTWLAEAALWTMWVHVGHASATMYSEVVAVDATKAVHNVKWTPTLAQITTDYCKNYHRRLQAAKPPESNWPDDLQVPMTDWCDVVLTMKKDSQVMIGLEALKHVHSGRGLGQRRVTGLVELRAEVQAGKSTVMLNAKGDLERVVSMVAFKIFDECDQILVQLGKQEGAVMKTACQLPGGKQERGELVSETAARLLEDKLTPLANRVEIQRTERESFTKESKDFGVKTKYLRNIVLASLDKEAELDHLEVRLPNGEGPEIDESSGICRSGRHRPTLTLSLGSAWHGSRGGSPQRQATGLNFNFSRQNSFISPESEKLRCSLEERRAFLFRDRKGMAGLYVWASEKEFEHLKSSDFEEMLAPVVSQFMVQAHADGLWNADSSPRSP